MPLITHRRMLEIMGDDLHGSPDAISARARRVAKANGFTQHRNPGKGGLWYDPIEVRAKQGGKPLPMIAA